MFDRLRYQRLSLNSKHTRTHKHNKQIKTIDNRAEQPFDCLYELFHYQHQLFAFYLLLPKNGTMWKRQLCEFFFAMLSCNFFISMEMEMNLNVVGKFATYVWNNFWRTWISIGVAKSCQFCQLFVTFRSLTLLYTVHNFNMIRWCEFFSLYAILVCWPLLLCVRCVWLNE